MPKRLRLARPLSFAVLALTALLSCIAMPKPATAHFSYSDPRIVHIAENDDGHLVILVRMPAPLALLPADWQGGADTGLTPFSFREGAEVFLDRDALRLKRERLHRLLTDGLSVWLDDQPQEISVGRTQFWRDADRPSFGTAKSALRAFETGPAETNLPYFNSTLDVEFLVPGDGLNASIRVSSELGRNFKVINSFATVVKLRRDGGTETRAMIGVLDADFPGIQSNPQQLASIGLIGAETIYLGFDHLAMLLLIAIAAKTWRQALFWASVFALGQVVTLTDGVYGFIPKAVWFSPSIELLIVFSVVGVGTAIVLKLPHVMNGLFLLAVGLIHGYGLAAAASATLFAGGADAAGLLAFVVGVVLCQFAIYLAALPTIVLLDRAARSTGFLWRKPVALGLGAAASLSIIHQLMRATGFSFA